MPDEPTCAAEVRLRPPAPRARLHRPRPTPGPPPGLVVLLAAPEQAGLAGPLAHALVAVVLAVPAVRVCEAYAVLAWAADHAAELGADPARVGVVGIGVDVAAAQVAELAAREGWPRVHVAVTVRPGEDAVLAALAGWAR